MKTTEENNRMIAEFMEIKDGDNDRYSHESSEYFFEPCELEYHTSWDWLMPVVEKIESVILDDDNSFNVTIGATNYCVIQDSNGEVFETIQDYGNSKLETVYNAVVKFIEWYNEQQKP